MVEESQPTQRRLPACERCRSRKTKCDSQLPSCANCVKAGVQCMNKDRVLGRAVTRSYVCTLEERIRAFGGNGEPGLEGLELPAKRPRLSDARSPSRSPVSNTRQQQASESNRSESDHSATSSNEDNVERIVSPLVTNTMEALLASSLSGGGPATNVSDDLSVELNQYPHNRRGDKEQFIQNENMAIAKLGRDFLKRARRTRGTNISAYDFGLLARLAKRYFTWMGSAHPILHECVFQLQLEKCRMRPNEASLQDSFQVNMVIAVSLASLSRPHLSMSEIGRYAHDFWKLACKSLSQVLSGKGIQKIQNILLLLQYTLLVPKSGNLWQLSGSAMRFATEMGLYAEPNPSQEFDALALDLRRRVFWTCYCIDRILSTVMGRPTSIPDSWITTKIPALVEDRLITVNGIRPGPVCQLKVAQVQQLRICRLQSDIHKRLYAPVMDDEYIVEENTTAWMWHMYDQLRLWRDSFTYATPLITKEWTELQFHIAVVLLFRPSPNRPNPSDEALHVAFHSAGEAMKLVKTMHRDLSAVFSWLTVQNLFMCGLTFINSLKEFADKHTSHELCISFVEIFLQIQACTAMLETLSALEAGSNERIRNVFEMASSNILHSLASSSPHMQQGGHGPEGCIWAQIAKSDSLMIQRPTEIEGTSIAIKMDSKILHETNVQNWNNCVDSATDEHFSEHDLDAAPVKSLLPLDPKLYKVAVSGAAANTSVPSANAHARSRAPSRESSLPPASQTAADYNPPVSMPLQDPHMDGLSAISKVAAEAEPLRNVNDLPDWSETDLGAELERWFLYPFPEISPPVSVMMNDQDGL